MIAAHQTMLAPQGGPSSLDYVQDGLYLMLDGIENAGRYIHDPSSSTWKDLAGSNDFSVDTNNSEWGDNYLYAKNRNAASREFVPFNSTCTIQFVVDTLYNTTITGNSAYILLGTNNTKYYGLLYRGSSNALMAHLAYFSWTSYAGHRLLSFSNIGDGSSGAWFDGVFKSPSGSNSLDVSSSRGNIARIGGTGDIDRPCKIHGIRIYSRALSEREIAINDSIDRARFNLP